MSNTPGELIFPPLSDIFGDGGTGGGPAPEGAISNRGQLISDFAQRLHTGEGSPPPDDPRPAGQRFRAQPQSGRAADP